ncbi:nicotinamide-nucleotide amidase [Pedobacter sp. AK017]|uniref:CinA family protein n=1 Tax=Pedobacter sp. AK017 TaxID=2723073 RepID=UPI00161505C3|nr:nicotinamide-nucleotide amidohydrolase family protein [Pedobacter sp. AK017]MBB5436538.1 nicotinamide-nucleotide amidase [Pedobacter sp. AK017]
MKKDIDDADLKRCGKLLIQHQLTIAFAESATAGRISAEFAMVPDAGKFLKGGIVCYDADLKCSLLKVPKKQLKEFTPESETVTRSITQGIQKLIPADIHIGCTGLTAPGGSETPWKPVGTMFLHGIQGQQQILDERIVFQGNPDEIISQTITFLARQLHQYLKAKNK